MEQQLQYLRGICIVLGVDTSENGLSGCELFSEYLKRISLMLGVVNA